MAFDPRSDRAQTAIARTKWLHQGYRSSGKILESDMLYTLSLFATEPIRFVERYEWRQMTEMERCAVGTYWKSLGDALGISYDVLPSGETGFKDGIHWLDEISAWSLEYEIAHMKPDPKTRDLADKVIEVLLYNLPGFIKPVGGYLVSWLMDERLRSAMMYVPMTPFYNSIHTHKIQDKPTTITIPNPLHNALHPPPILPPVPCPPAPELPPPGRLHRRTEPIRAELHPDVRGRAVLCATHDLESLGPRSVV